MSDSTIASTTGGSLNELAGQYCVELERLNYGRETINRSTSISARSAGSVSSWSATVWRSTS
jgi:hypothetical protein